MRSGSFKAYTMRMTPKNKALAAFVIIFVLLLALAMLAVAAVGGAIAAISSGIVGGIRRLFGISSARIGASPSGRVPQRKYDDLDPSKRIDPPQD
ncbi:MAG: hypothetical protein NDJ18_10330 [candidate division Zixibacteria bacterium]|nr:hypothetical protein [candidate division Zixibacteria bacterium]